MQLPSIGAEETARPVPLGHLPLVRHAIDALGIRAVVDRLCPPDPRMEVSNGDCVTVMILNVLQGRVALYDMAEWLAGTDADVLLWEGCPTTAFHDDRLGLALDNVFHAGTDYVFSEVARGVLAMPEIGTSYSAHLDTTSVSLQGRYDEDPERPWPAEAPRPARGFSKDQRSDLKQLIYGLTVHGPTRIPLNFSVHDGNTADPVANRFQIDSLTQLLPPEHDVTLVADCKFVDAASLGQARLAGFHYVSLLPHTFGLRHALVERVREAGKTLAEVGRFPGRRLDSPERIYRATSFVEPFAILDPTTNQRTAPDHRFVVVRSSTAAAEFDATIDRRVEKEGSALETALNALARRNFSCEQDLRREVERLVAKAEHHLVDWTVETVEIAIKRGRAGRPRAGETPPTETVWKLTRAEMNENLEKIDVARFHAAHFVLVTDHLDAEQWSDLRIFGTYRAQESIEGHAGFRWLKNIADVAPVFLKLPHRIQALALVLLLALMVRNWIEAKIRRELLLRDATLPNFNDRPTKRPTAENVFRLFRYVSMILVERGGRKVDRSLHYLDSGPALLVLDLFGLTPLHFKVPRQKSWTVGGRKGEM